MIADAPNANAYWSALAIEELTRLGVELFVISPGSRSTPLTLAAAAHPKAQTKIILDERGAAFIALGYARASQKPAALICTSGTALANYYPAIIEASVDCVPLLILSADRPPELRETGANQTIRQTTIYGDYLRWFTDMPCPTNEIAAEFVLTSVDQAHHRALCSPAGPVQINWMFREPLAPTATGEIFEHANRRIEKWLTKNTAFTHYEKSASKPPSEATKKLVKKVNGKQGILVAGQLRDEAERHAVRTLAAKLGWPVFADITSGLRTGERLPNVIAMHDVLLRSPAVAADLLPKVVLQIGARLTSKRLLTFLRDCSCDTYILLANHPFRHDPDHRVTLRLHADIAATCLEFAQKLPEQKHAQSPKIVHQNAHAEQALNRFFDQSNDLSEPGIAHAVAKLAPQNSVFFLASSMPVRDMDNFAVPGGPALHVFANRGASGIDGTISSAIGCALGCQASATLLIGDIAFLHDLNALQQLRSLEEKLVIVVINNNGGGIFSFLPVAEFKTHFERFFATPHGLTFKPAAELFKLNYEYPRTSADFKEAYLRAWQRSGSALIEVQTEREQNLEMHKKIAQLVLDELA